MQIFVTTHSEALISAFGERLDSVLVCENYLGQGTVLKHLDTEVLSVWLEKYSLGEIWRAGEIGGNP